MIKYQQISTKKKTDNEIHSNNMQNTIIFLSIYFYALKIGNICNKSLYNEIILRLIAKEFLKKNKFAKITENK